MIQLLPISAILAMSVDEQDKLAMEVGRVETKAKDATQAHKLSFPMAGKVVYAVQKRLSLKSSVDESGKPKKPQISLATSLATFWESITKANGKSGVKLNNHWLSCAVTFGTVRRFGVNHRKRLRQESSGQSRIGFVHLHRGRRGCHARSGSSGRRELRDRSKSSAKNLQAILDTVKEPKEMTVEQAQKAIAKVMASGHLCVVIAAVGAEIAHVEDAEVARNAFFGMITANEMFAANMTTKDGKSERRFTDKTLDAWCMAYQQANAPKETPPATPVLDTEANVTQTPQTAPVAVAA